MKYNPVDYIKLGGFRQYQNTKTILKKKNMAQNRFKKLSKLQKFQLSKFTLNWSNKLKMNSVRPDMTYSKELQQKIKILDKLILKTFEINNFNEILSWLYVGSAIVF